jgi:hypothetical protein
MKSVDTMICYTNQTTPQQSIHETDMNIPAPLPIQSRKICNYTSTYTSKRRRRPVVPSARKCRPLRDNTITTTVPTRPTRPPSHLLTGYIYVHQLGLRVRGYIHLRRSLLVVHLSVEYLAYLVQYCSPSKDFYRRAFSRRESDAES